MARILVVDDHAHVRGAIRRILTRAGHQVWDVCDGPAALELMGAIGFDVVITDVYLGAMDGMELLVRSQQRGYRQPVIVMSGGGFAPRGELLNMAKACGAFGTVTKPFSPHDITESVGKALAPAAVRSPEVSRPAALQTAAA
jgi:DNA-binding NtrC family response regulator